MSIARQNSHLNLESLEVRRLLAGDTDCQCEAAECSPAGSDQFCVVGAECQLELKGRLTGSGREHGEAELEVESDDDGLEIGFEVEVEKAEPGSVHTVSLDGVEVGQITIGANGQGRLRLGNKGDEPDQRPLPPGFPQVGASAEVKVGTILNGQLGNDACGEQREEQEDGQDIHFSAHLAGAGPEKGEAEFEKEDDDDQVELELEVEVEKAEPGSVHDVAVDGVVVAQITIGANGHGRLHMATHPENEGDLPIPDNFPANVGAGSELSVGTILRGAFSMHGDLNEDRCVDSKDVDMLFAAIQVSSNDARYDLNGDRSVDTGDVHHLVEGVIGTVFGDANMDGIFDSSDLVAVFKKGQYADSTPKNSTWATGDWNGDGEFDSSDLVLAFQAGGYAAPGKQLAG